ncbi:MAG: CoA transferase [bacterium]|nr:CoA transferase [Acidimicrobiia bacterium]MCY4649983.1 CoA transferase [bacterium]
MTKGPLDGVRVIDIATLFAGPMAATMLADYGASVIKVEHPRGDPVRNHGHSKDGVPLWWKALNRNKQAITLNLSTPEGRDLLLRLVADADVLIENFRPGTLERWDLAPELLMEVNPGLVIARVSGFGQFGPYSRRPGFGTLAESMSGFASLTGQPDGPPTLPPFGLADGITGLTVANAVLMALMHRDRTGQGRGQVIDCAIIEPIMAMLGPHALVYDQLGIIQPRTGNRSANNAPRNTYQTRDNRWVAISTSAQSIAERVVRLVGYPELVDEPWFSSAQERAKRSDLLDKCVGDWIAQRDLEEVVEAFTEAQAAVAPIYDISQIMEDPQYQALDTIIEVDDPQLGKIKMQNIMFRMSETPGQVRWSGRPAGADNRQIYCEELGLSDQEVAELTRKGVV